MYMELVSVKWSLDHQLHVIVHDWHERDVSHFQFRMMSFVARLVLSRHLRFGFLSSLLLGLALSSSAIALLVFVPELFLGLHD